MKRKQCLLILVVLLLMPIASVNATTTYCTNTNEKLIGIVLNFHLTTHIYFESNVDYVDIGFGEGLIWKSIDNLIKITPETQEFSVPYTNMTVHTEQGIYGFMIKMDDNQKILPYYFISPSQALKLNKKIISKTPNNTIVNRSAVSENRNAIPTTTRDLMHDQPQKTSLNQEKPPKVNNRAEKSKIIDLLNAKSRFSNIGTIKDKIMVYMSDIYVIDDRILIKLIFKNNSHLDFSLSYCSFSIKNNQNKKYSVKEENHIQPEDVYPKGITKIVANKKKTSVIYSFTNFVPSSHEIMDVYLGETNGRAISFAIPSAYFLKAKQL